MAQDWNIKSRGHVCSVCGRPLEDKCPVTSVLRDSGNGYERMDCHPECWNTLERDWEPFSLWEGVYTAPPPPDARKEPVKKETAGELLRKLVALDDPEMKNAVYVLAVMLERSKILVERDSRELPDGTVRRIYEDRKNGDSFVILDPRLRLDAIGSVQRQVVALLGGTEALPGPGKKDAPQQPAGTDAPQQQPAGTGTDAQPQPQPPQTEAKPGDAPEP